LLVEHDAADEHVRQAIDNLERASDMTGLCTALRLLGPLLDSTGKLDEAAATLQRGLKIAERTGLVEETAAAWSTSGWSTAPTAITGRRSSATRAPPSRSNAPTIAPA
jgi:hypothetical protein